MQGHPYHYVFIAKSSCPLARRAFPSNVVHIHKCLFIKFTTFLNGKLIESIFTFLHAPLDINLHDRRNKYTQQDDKI